MRRKRTLGKAIILTSGKQVPKGTKLSFGLENKAYYAGEEVDEELIPAEAFEDDDLDLLAGGFAEAVENIEELADKAIEGDEDAIAAIAELAADTSTALQELIEETDCSKSAIEDGFGDLDVETIESLKDSIDDVVDKLKDAADEVEVEDAVEQFRSIFKK